MQRFFWGVGVLLLMCSFIATAWSPWSWGLAGKVLAATLLIYGSTGFLGVFGPSHKVASRLAIKLLPYWWGILLFLALLHQKTTSRFSFLERVQPLWDAMPHAGLVAWLMGREASGLVLACHSVVAALCFALMWRRYRNVLTGKADRPEVQVVQEPLMISQALEDEEEWLPERVTDPREMLKAKIDAETFEEAEGRCLIDRYHAFPRAPLRVLALIGVGGCLAVMLEALPREWLRVLWNQMPSEVRVSWLNWDLRWMIGLMALAAGVFLVTKMASVVWRALKFPSYFAMRCLEEAMGQPAWVWLPLDLQRAARWHRGWANVWIWRGLQVHAWVWGGFLVVGYCFWLLQRWLPEPDSLFVFPRFAKVLVLIGLEVVGYGIFRWWHSVVEFRAAYRDAEVGRSGWI
ncbi:MAG: hypothetical protein KDK99_02965 [Verrucomicrobiales bacterium]|nr:hypothetical protein [Verrucomicrobiales bacterium]